MVKTTRLAAGLLFVFSLVGCDALFTGPFPASLGQATVRADLSAVIASADAAQFDLAICRSYGFEFVILSSPSGSSGTTPRMIVMSPALVVKNSYSLNDIPFFAGSSAFSHLFDGHIVVGNVDGLATSAGLVLSGQIPNTAPLSGWSLLGARLPTLNAYAWSGFQVDQANTMTWNAYQDDWSPTPPTMFSRVIRAVDANHPRLWLSGAFTDPEDERGNASLFVFGESGTNTEYFVQVPKSPDLETPPATPIFSSGYPTFTKSNLDSGTIAVTSDSVVAFDGSARSWIRFTLAAPGTVTSLRVARRGSHERSAFSFSGGYYCIWDPDTRTVTRYEDWW
jgi:hypothetical protein